MSPSASWRDPQPTDYDLPEAGRRGAKRNSSGGTGGLLPPSGWVQVLLISIIASTGVSIVVAKIYSQQATQAVLKLQEETSSIRADLSKLPLSSSGETAVQDDLRGLRYKLAETDARLQNLTRAIASSETDTLRTRCRLVSAKESSSVSYGDGSKAFCGAKEIAVGGACRVDMSARGTNSKFLIQRNVPIGFECILAQGTAQDSVTASAICCE